MHSDKQAGANTVNPDEMSQNVASNQGSHFLPLIQLLQHKASGSIGHLFKFHNKYGRGWGIQAPRTNRVVPFLFRTWYVTLAGW